jgi:hypothetical protein
MSQGIFSALAYLEDQLEATTPKTDLHHGFVAHSRANGLTTPLEERYNSQRYFVLDLADMPSDDGAAGLSGRRRATINLRVRYDIPQDMTYLFRLMAEDAEYLMVTLKGPDYSLATTGIVSVIPSPPNFEPLNIGEQGIYILTIPFTLLYLEA